MNSNFSAVHRQPVTPPTVPAPTHPTSLGSCDRTAIVPELNIPQLSLPPSVFDHGTARLTCKKEPAKNVPIVSRDY